MGFFDRILNRRPAKEKPFVKTTHTTPQVPDPGIVCEMEVNGNKYMMKGFELGIDKSRNSMPVAMKVVFDDRPDKALESWIMRDSTARDGIVKFFRNTDTMEEGALHSVSFHGAVCTGYEKSVVGITPVTTLRLQARHINISGEEYQVR